MSTKRFLNETIKTKFHLFRYSAASSTYMVRAPLPVENQTVSFLQCHGAEINLGFCMFAVNDTSEIGAIGINQSYVLCGKGKPWYRIAS